MLLHSFTWMLFVRTVCRCVAYPMNFFYLYQPHCLKIPEILLACVSQNYWSINGLPFGRSTHFHIITISQLLVII